MDVSVVTFAGYNFCSRTGASIEFRLERPAEGAGWRATVRATDEPEQARRLCLVWQEEWSSPMSFDKWIVGKLLYQKPRPGGGRGAVGVDGLRGELYACPYRIDGKAVSVNFGLEERVPALLPPDAFKLGCTC